MASLKRALLTVLGLAILVGAIAGAVHGNFAWKRHKELALFTQFDDWRWQYFWGGVKTLMDTKWRQGLATGTSSRFGVNSMKCDWMMYRGRQC